jgi:hypothetical protein
MGLTGPEKDQYAYGNAHDIFFTGLLYTYILIYSSLHREIYLNRAYYTLYRDILHS